MPQVGLLRLGVGLPHIGVWWSDLSGGSGLLGVFRAVLVFSFKADLVKLRNSFSILSGARYSRTE